MLAVQTPQPDLVIYLQAPVDVLMSRVQHRGVSYEKHIELSYLQRLSDAYVDFFYHYDDAPLLIVNAKDIDVASNERDYQQLLQRISSIHSGRHYYNPAPDLLKE